MILSKPRRCILMTDSFSWRCWPRPEPHVSLKVSRSSNKQRSIINLHLSVSVLDIPATSTWESFQSPSSGQLTVRPIFPPSFPPHWDPAWPQLVEFATRWDKSTYVGIIYKPFISQPSVIPGWTSFSFWVSWLGLDLNSLPLERLPSGSVAFP